MPDCNSTWGGADRTGRENDFAAPLDRHDRAGRIHIFDAAGPRTIKDDAADIGPGAHGKIGAPLGILQVTGGGRIAPALADRALHRRDAELVPGVQIRDAGNSRCHRRVKKFGG